MAVTSVTTVDVAQILAALLGDVDGLRVEWYVADKSRPPVAVIGQPTIDFRDPDATFCFARWDFPITIITVRNNDRDAQQELSRLVCDVANALDGPTPPGVFSIEPVDARPGTATLAGQELPCYYMRVVVRA